MDEWIGNDWQYISGILYHLPCLKPTPIQSAFHLHLDYSHYRECGKPIPIEAAEVHRNYMYHLERLMIRIEAKMKEVERAEAQEKVKNELSYNKH